MTLLYVRAVAPYEDGANATDVIVNNMHFNRTALDFYNYKLYTNGTLSNGSDCYLAFNEWKPFMISENGTFVNGTSCYAPIRGIGHHAAGGLVFTVFFGISIFLTLLNLRKHGRKYLPHDKNWILMGRRWKWYWLLFAAACGLISCIMSIDVDRSYLPSTPIILQGIFYTLMTPSLMAAVWEAVRHWGSWQERQIKDRDPYAFTKSSTRKRQELVLPILFYICAIANVVLTIPRSWSPIEQQRSTEQQELIARPTATDSRWRAAGFVALAGVLVICYSLEHSIYRYRTRPNTSLGQLLFYLNAAPSQFLVALAILGLKIGYAIASAFDWSVSPLKYDVSSGWLYGLGYLPAFLILLLFNICGFCELNDDKALIAQRVDIDHALASDVGIGLKKEKPHWWTRDRWKALTREIARRSSPNARKSDSHDLEMGVVDGEKEDAQVTTRTASQTTQWSAEVGRSESSFEPAANFQSMTYTVQPGNEESRQG
ncbi:hypothetical protein FE257_002357 [Aspergillus nanangensis]|uniref:Uncharacterized protein n=1 Tax=Aspergillus nanangensis TaxID=2582783 RepID=A0AAD4GQ63_ASPNN|nr:hypothetical protein FE257_002357 [Aspergillus nanangensis]